MNKLQQRILPRLRKLISGRLRNVFIVVLGACVGVAAGLVVTAIGWLVNALHHLLFNLPSDSRLSAQAVLQSPWLALVPAVGGALLAISIILSRRFRARPPVDPIEANAIHGGQMSFRESLIVTGQIIISSGFGASVGLEAGYTQMASVLGSKAAAFLRLRRNEIRTLVGCGAAGAIAAAFNTPITGAFYAFELIIGVYSVALLAPVIAASLAATFTARALSAFQTPIEVGGINPLASADIPAFLALGIVGGALAVGIMLLVTQVERGFSWLRCPQPLRPIIGGAAVGALALITPAVLSSGHGALQVHFIQAADVSAIALLFVLKVAASSLSLGAGFRGGLFFASLFLGALFGRLFAIGIATSGLAPGIDPVISSLVGMASLAVGIVGGPLTMTFLVLETTGDLAISAAVLVASAFSSIFVRETFGYSFSTWRLHLRGETIRAPHDVGRLRNLTVGKMMRADVKTVPEDTTIEAFRQKYPLGSTERVIATDRKGRYAGIVLVAEAYGATEGEAEAGNTIARLLKYKDRFLLPGLNVADAAAMFEKASSEELAVVDNLGNRQVIGLLTEAYLLRRYTSELDKGWKDLTG
ncbi:chloride channel protein [Youhaiella tibetensis]|nr:chloride channel protein [Youhaiella tibetensis]GGF48041.1 chloride channel protein [Youhaiella tibetensis]